MLEVPSLPSAETAADWAEICCLLEDKPTISRSEIEVILEEGNVDAVEKVIGDIWQQINWRHSKAPNNHPINASMGRLEKKKTWKQSVPYFFMLLLSCNWFYDNTEIKRKQWVPTSKLFEKLVTEAMKNYLGNAINIGSPRSDGIPTSFNKCLDYVCKKINERRGQNDPLIHWRKDAGVDIVSWKPFDERSGQVLVLVQCAAGGKWGEKTSDINLKRWNKLIDFAADPIRGLAFPHVYSTSSVESEDRWLDYSWDGGILLDRLRIAIFSRINTRSMRKMKPELVKWCFDQIEDIYTHKVD